MNHNCPCSSPISSCARSACVAAVSRGAGVLRRPHAIEAIRLRQTRLWVILGDFGDAASAPDDMRADAVHEILGVRHEEEDLRPLREVVFQPKHGLHI